MANLVVATNFKPRLDELLSNLPQSVLLHGEPGIGLGAMARHIAGPHARILQPLTRQGEVDFETGTISVDAIRLLYQQTRAKSSRAEVVIIEAADMMSLGAQNAFLKLLEEPSSSTRFVLTTHHRDQLLPTILSRVQSYHLPRISENQSRLLLSKLQLDESEYSRVLFLASGRPALLTRLATDENLRQSMAEIMVDARDFITNGRSYQSLVLAVKYSASRARAESFVDALMAVLRHTLYTAPSADTIGRAEDVANAKVNLAANANPKLQLMRLVVK